AAAQIMYYGGDIAELLLAGALVATWRPMTRRTPVAVALEEHVGGLGLERDAAEFDDLGLQPALVVGGDEPGDPFGGGGERDPVPGLAGPDAQADGQHRLAGAGRAEEDRVLLGSDEVQGAQVGEGLPVE